MKKTTLILFLLILFISIQVKSQGHGTTYIKTVSGTVNISQGSVKYTTDIVFRIQDAGYGDSPSALKIGFKNSKITSITYKGKSGSSLLTDVSFPVATRFQATIQGQVLLRSNSGPNQVDINFSVGDASQGGLDTYDFPTEARNRIKQKFGESVTFNDLKPILNNINLTGVIIHFNDLINKMDAKIRELEAENRLAEKAKKAEEQENSSNSSNSSNNTSSSSNSQTNSSDSNGYSTSSKEETLQEKEKRLQLEEAKKKADIAKKKEETLQEKEKRLQLEEAKKKADIAKKKEEFQRSESLRKERIQQQNNQILTSTTMAQAGVMYLLGTLIYGNYGQIPGDVYSGSNLNIGIDGGYGLTASPIYYNSMKETPQFGGGTSISNELRYSHVATVDLNTSLYMNYEKRVSNIFEVGVGTYVSGTAGFLPLGFTQVAGNFGFTAFGGFNILKFYIDYEKGTRQLSDGNWLAVDEYGLGKTEYGKRTWKLGAKFSFYNGDNLSRHHVSFGVIRQRLIPSEDISFQDDIESVSIQSRVFADDRESDQETLRMKDFIRYKGFFFEWKHENHGRLFLNFFPYYPYTGVAKFSGTIEDDQKDGNLFFQVGFSRRFEDFIKI